MLPRPRAGRTPPAGAGQHPVAARERRDVGRVATRRRAVLLADHARDARAPASRWLLGAQPTAHLSPSRLSVAAGADIGGASTVINDQPDQLRNTPQNPGPSSVIG